MASAVKCFGVAKDAIIDALVTVDVKAVRVARTNPSVSVPTDIVTTGSAFRGADTTAATSIVDVLGGMEISSAATVDAALATSGAAATVAQSLPLFLPTDWR